MIQDDILTGDTLLVRSNTFISKMICRVMKHWGKKNNRDTSVIYSHAARFIWIAGKLYLFGSVDNGYNPIIFSRHYSFTDSDYAIMRRKVPLSQDEINQTINFCLHLDTLSVSYQYWNFVQWICLVYLHINLFKKDSKKFTYCYEAERLARKDLNPDNYKEVYITDIFNLLYDSNYDIKYVNNPGTKTVIKQAISESAKINAN